MAIRTKSIGRGRVDPVERGAKRLTIILPEGRGRRRETRVTNSKSRRRSHQTPDMPQGLQLRSRLGGGAAIRHGPYPDAVPHRGSRPARQYENWKALRLHLAHQFIGVGVAGEAA